MNFRTATLLVLGMFGSFMVVVTIMIFLFWSPSRKKTIRKPVETSAEKQPPSVIHVPNVVTAGTSDPTSAAEATTRRVERVGQTEERPETPEPEPNTQTAAPPKPSRPPGGHVAQRNVQLEQDEMKLLREAMERRLKARMLTRERKLGQLARRCEALEAGEAVQILVALGDSDLGQVLERMDRAKALQVAALLDRLGRGKAISLK